MAKRVFICLFIMAFIGFASVFLGVNKTEKVSASDDQILSGFGWFGADNCLQNGTGCVQQKTNPVGWVSFGDKNINTQITCGVIPYGVSANGGTGYLSGAAWVGVGENNVNFPQECNTTEKTVGWLDFDANNTPSCGSGGYSSDYCFPAKVVGNEIQGWAPIISKGVEGGQATVTWVRFKGSNYSNVINQDGTIGACGTGADHYAWAGEPSEGGLGWLDLCRVNLSGFIEKYPPVVAVEAIDSSACSDFCSGQVYSQPQVIIHMAAFDQDIGDNIDYREILISTDSEFSDIVSDSGKIEFSPHLSGCFSGSECDFDYVPTGLQWDMDYYVKVTVWDKGDNPSEPAETRFSTSLRAPDVQISANPSTIVLNKDVTFSSSQSLASCQWTFDDGAPSTSNKCAPPFEKVRFSVLGSKDITLTFPDPNGGSCCVKKTFRISGANPLWREIIPFWK